MATKRNTSDSKWYQAVWLPFAAATYIIICIFDFMIMPVYVAAHNSRVETMVFKTLEAKDAAEFADTLAKTNQAQRQWNPLTLMGAGMFHLAFGALLTGGAVTRGFAKKSEIEGYYRYGERPGYDDEYEDPYNQGYRQSPYGGSYNRRNNYAPRTTGSAGPQPKTTGVDDQVAE